MCSKKRIKLNFATINPLVILHYVSHSYDKNTGNISAIIRASDYTSVLS